MAISEVFAGFRHFGKAWITSILFSLIVGAGAVLLVIPGIIWALKYSFGFFAVLDRSLSPRAALRFSGKITQGYKGKLLGAVLAAMALILPFLMLFQLAIERGELLTPPGILGILLYVVGVFVIGPWINASYASVYDTLVAVYERSEERRVGKECRL